MTKLQKFAARLALAANLIVVTALVGLSAAGAFHFDLPTGYFESTGQNEVTLVDTTAEGDPVKFRGGARNGRGLVCFSANRVRSNGVQDEVGMICGKIDERYPNLLGGEWEVFVQNPFVGGDAGMERAITIRYDGITFHKPVNMTALDGEDKLVATNGRYRLYMQCDGNVVLYAVLPQPWKPLWSSGTSTGGC